MPALDFNTGWYSHLLPCCALVLLSAALSAAAQPVLPAATPVEPVRIVVPYVNGDVEDVLAREIFATPDKSARRPFLVDNRPGGTGHHGAEVVARAKPDGSVVLFAPFSYYAAEAVLYQLHYDPVADFTPVTLAANAPQLLFAHPSLPVKSVGELIAFAKAQPGQVKWGWHNQNAFTELQTDMFWAMTGIKVGRTSHSDANSVMLELLGGRIELTFDGIVGTLSLIKSGKLRPLAVSGSRRAAAQPDVPTIAQSGIKGYEADYWYALLAPEGTDLRTVSELREDFSRRISTDDVKKRLLSHGVETAGNLSADLATIMRAESAKWAKVFAQMRTPK